VAEKSLWPLSKGEFEYLTFSEGGFYDIVMLLGEVCDFVQLKMHLKLSYD